VEVVSGVYRIPLPLPQDGLRAVNVYALVSDDDLVLIDSGWAVPGARDMLLAALDGLGRGPRDIRRFLITHVHRDHYTQAIDLRRDFGNRVTLGIGERVSLDLVRDTSRSQHDPQLAKLLAMGADGLAALLRARDDAAPGEDRRWVWQYPDDWFEPPETVSAAGRSLLVLPTPGHTSGHVVFHDEAAGLLFAGDHVLPEITPSIGFDGSTKGGALGDYLSSLARVRARPDALLLPAHGPVTDSVHRRIDELLDHHGVRLDQTHQAVAAGASTGLAVAAQLPWTRRGRRFDELDPDSQMLAVCETAAHLELLVVQGRVRVQRENGVLHFTA